MGVDTETIGWGAFEVLRNARREPKRLRNAPAWTLRALPRNREAVEVRDTVRVTDITWEEVTDTRAFRRYVQVYEGTSVYFKEFGDPRFMSSVSGKVYKDLQSLQATEPQAKPATELLWFMLDNPESDVYGLIRWSGNILSVLGSREMEEVNLLFFDNKAIPPLVILVSGGHLAADAKEELQQIIRDHIKGRRNFHRILILEAESSSTAGQLSGLPGQQSVRIELKPLTEAIFKDQMWGEYDRENRHKVGQSFRMPPILRGDTKDFNRSTAVAAIRYTEDQVFKPDRDDFDFEINRTLVRDLRVLLWRFKSKSTFRPDPAEILERVEGLTNSIITPQEARLIVALALGADLPKVEAAWARLPLKYALAGFEPEGAVEAPPPAGAVDTGQPPEAAQGGLGAQDGANEGQPPVERLKIDAATFRRLFPSELSDQ
jgi:PBSX family phage portal protein